jgi:pilus assembly protein Flp/PilA
MNNSLIKLYVKMQTLLAREDGQDLVEYALVISLVAVALVTVIPNLTAAITATFNKIEGSL